ncbi:nucleotide sugar dehydrogenase [Aurantiacibacter sp. MUD11]|uniref:nucleotide sugar dehydrogenase n=1 Tax=Aurantiacibacter sp. MUD11 TaxID=3003265 RepID=UPI0022AAFC20|nr:nucleotide sugar dehydrogenase [Aurantiacibacter sp. MUD11]WAT17575.1 nucleotide sugar dehydrogenase [Aurantiacibacter sp. MUD11]
MTANPGQILLNRLEDRSARVGVIGMGYVGLPLALAVVDAGYSVTGFDVDAKKPEALAAGRSYFKHIDSAKIAAANATGRFDATTDFARLAEVDVIAICVPTPLDRHFEPDLSFVEQTTETIARTLRPGQLVILESTTYPGTTDEVLKPILERGGLTCGEDFFLAFSPEREDPGNPDFGTTSIPKVVGADDDTARAAAAAFYGAFIGKVVPVSNTRAAEATKLTENIFRSVNIALVNELKLIYEPMGVDVWEVIEAAKTKPFGFMPFYPGPGLGGHCIPIDPFYLTWKAREYAVPTRFIELAGEINSSMPGRVIEKLALAVDQRLQKGLNGTRVLVLGAAYKKNVDDMRESPALEIMELLQDRGAQVSYFDPFVPEIPKTREHPSLTGMASVAWKDDLAADYDALLLVTDHDGVDYRALLQHAALVVDTRNAFRRAGVDGDNLVLA